MTTMRHSGWPTETNVNDPTRGRIKCVVWDLDETLWRGVLLEEPTVVPRREIVAAIQQLDERGILNSIASRNDHTAAVEQLATLGLDALFLHPQIGWQPKSESVGRIAHELNIGLDAIAFVDDQPFERAEVAYHHPDVLCVDTEAIVDAVQRWPQFRPRFITAESRQRRALYQADIHRRDAERAFAGTDEQFLATLNMTLTIWPATTQDLQRAEELTVRTHQLNSTGRTYSYEQLDQLRHDPNHLLLVASLRDRFGSYGTIGLALVERGSDPWHLRLLLMSCRVASRGVGTVLLNHVQSLAAEAGVTLRGDFVENGRNRMMYVTYAFAGFEEVARDGPHAVLECRPSAAQPPPAYLSIIHR